MDLPETSRPFTLPLQTEHRTSLLMAPQLDHNRLRTLYDDMGNDRAFVIGLVEMYRARADAFVTAARSEVAGRSLADLAHQLAGASGPFGMVAIAEAALRLEAQLRAGQPHGDHLDLILADLPPLLAELQEWARQLPADPQSNSSR
jgi:HPt (histidine-containing phosphotransfer) domain-containing protein